MGLADVQVRADSRELTEVLHGVRGRDVHGMTAVVTGHCSPEEAAELVSATNGSSRGVLVTVVAPDPVVRGIMDRAGWRVLVIPVPGTTVSGRTR